MITLPHFKSEAEEAEWWFQNQDVIAAEFERVKPKLGPSRALQMLAQKRGITVEELRARHYSKQVEPSEPVALTKLPRSA